MGDFPQLWTPASEIISTCSPEALGVHMSAISFQVGTNSTNVASAAWQSANRALFIQVRISTPRLVQKFWVANGGTASGSFDIGLYAPDGTKLSSTGSTGQTGTSVIQAVDVTDFRIGPGIYYMALVMDGTAGTTTRVSFTGVTPIAGVMASFGCCEQATAFALPATATFATCATFTILPIFGFACRVTV